MTSLKALFQSAALVLALAWSPVASATGKALTLSLHPVYLVFGLVELTYESQIEHSNHSWYVALGTTILGGLYLELDYPMIRSAVGYRVYPVGSYHSGLTLSADIGGFYYPGDTPAFLARSFVGGKRTTRFGLVLDGGTGISLIGTPGDLPLLFPCLKANIGIAF